MKSAFVVAVLWLIVCLSCFMIGAYVGVIGYTLGRSECLTEVRP